MDDEKELTLGKRLRLMTDRAKSVIEVQNLVKVLEDAANNGQEAVQFTDLREYVPTMILSGTLSTWAAQNELILQGGVNQSTGAYEYIIKW